MLRNYWLIAIRNLWKHKVHALINVLGLTVGLASCLTIFLVTHFELGYDHFHPNGDRIYRIVTHENRPDQQSNFGAVPGPLPPALRKELTGFQAVSAFLNADSKLIIPGKSTGQQAKELDPPPAGTPSPIIITDPQYFQIFGYKWLAGNPATSLNDPYRVVLSAK
jgi:putative ABC transport system permease protein